MSKSRIVGMMALIAFAMGILLVDNAVAGESGKAEGRNVGYGTTIHTLKVPDEEGHIIMLYEAKGITFSEKFGNYLFTETSTMEVTKKTASDQGYHHGTFPDGSTFTVKHEGKGGKGTWTFIKGTGKFNGIQGGGTFKAYSLSPVQWYVDWEGEYTLP